MGDTIFAQHPDADKQGVNISKAKYNTIHHAICTHLEETGPSSLKSLTIGVKEQLGDSFDGSVGWYVTTVKLDMESRGEMMCDRSQSPHLHSLV